MSYLNWVQARMKVSRVAANRFKKEVLAKTSQNISILLCSHVEWKFVNMAALLHEVGADVTVVGNNPWTCKPECVAALQALGIKVFSIAGCTLEQADSLIAEAAHGIFQFIFDDGAHSIPKLWSTDSVISCTEFTISGTEKLKAIADTVKCPVYDLNSSFTKHCIGNEYGTGISTLAAFQMATNVSVSGLRVGIVGYGPVGKSVASAFKGAGAVTFVTEIDKSRWKKSELDGHYAMPIEDMGQRCDLLITCTGKSNIVSESVFRSCRDGLILANVGHFCFEIDTEQLTAMAKSVTQLNQLIRAFQLQDGRTLYLLCDGSLLNISCGQGFPIEIIDLSFAAAINCWTYSFANTIGSGVHPFPKEVDDLTMRDAASIQQTEWRRA